MPMMPGAAVPSRVSAPFGSLAGGYFPSSGIPFSVLAHGIVLAVILFASVFHTPPPPADPPKWVLKSNSNRDIVVMYLPAITPGGRGGPPGLDARPKVSARDSAPRTKGLIYPGPQPILSDPPNPTNRFQTVLQPDLKDRPILKTPLVLPNLVLTGDAGLTPRFGPPNPNMTTPEIANPEAQYVKPVDEEAQTTEALSSAEPKPRTSINALKLEVPAPLPLPKTRPQLVMAPASALMMVSPVEDVEEPGAELVEGKPDSAPKTDTAAANPEKGAPAVELSAVPIQGTDARNLLTLSVMPTLSAKPVEIPPGEARGQFAISPEPNVITPESEPGSPGAVDEASPSRAVAQTVSPGTNRSSGRTPAIVNISFGPSVDATSQVPSGGGNASTHVSRSASAGGLGGGTGSGGGGESGNAPFSGVTIVGGAGSGRSAAGSVLLPPTPRPLQTSYGLFVVSTERGGGGLPFFGVFGDQQVYTVFLDMRQHEADPTSSWVLEFALAEDTTTPGESATSIGSHQGLVLPFPAVKKRLELPAELVRRHLGKMVVVYALISTEGKMEQMSVKESPDPRLNEPVLEALRRWVFRPAVLDGQPVVMKVLLGLRL